MVDPKKCYLILISKTPSSLVFSTYLSSHVFLTYYKFIKRVNKLNETFLHRQYHMKYYIFFSLNYYIYTRFAFIIIKNETIFGKVKFTDDNNKILHIQEFFNISDK